MRARTSRWPIVLAARRTDSMGSSGSEAFLRLPSMVSPDESEAVGDWWRNPFPPGAANRSCQAAKASSRRDEASASSSLAGEGQHAFIMKLLPVDLPCLEEPAHLFTGPVEPRLRGA